MQDDDEYCAAQVQRFDRDRWLTALFAPASRRAGLMALYAFNLELARVRESVSEPTIGLMRLQWWRDALAAAASGGAREHPVARALAATPLVPADFEPMLLGRERDLDDLPMADLGALEAYAELTASGVVAAALKLLGASGAAAVHAAHHAGIGAALVGLLRATAFLARQRRCVLPADLMAAHGVDRTRLLDGRRQPGLAAVAQAVAARAREHLDRARAHRVPRRARAAVLPAALARQSLARLARHGFDVENPAAIAPSGFRALRLVWASVAGR